MSDVGTVLSTIISGMLLGGMLALTALGLSIVLGVMRLVNLAHGDFLVVGAYAGLFFLKFTGIDPLLGLPVIALLVAALAVPLDRARLRNAPPDARVGHRTADLCHRLCDRRLVDPGRPLADFENPLRTRSARERRRRPGRRNARRRRQTRADGHLRARRGLRRRRRHAHRRRVPVWPFERRRLSPQQPRHRRARGPWQRAGYARWRIDARLPAKPRWPE